MKNKGIFAYVSLLQAAAHAMEIGGPLRDALTDAWGTREFWSPFERPLLLCAALRDDALADEMHPLARSIGEAATGHDKVALEDLEQATMLGNFRTAIAERAVQTNETSRAIAWRLAMGAFAGEAPIALVDLGCSAGLNLIADRLAISWWLDDDDDERVNLAPTGRVRLRIGLDRRPVDVADPLEARWLRACVWPGQHDRLARLDEAIACGKAARDCGDLELVKLEAEQMPDFLERIVRDRTGMRVLAMQSAFIDYLSPDVRARFETRMRDWLTNHPERAAWVELGAATRAIVSSRTKLPHTAEIRLHRGRETRVLAACDWHPTSLTLLDVA